MKSILSVLSVFFLITFAHGDIVYEQVSTVGATFPSTTILEIGDEVTLGGTAREVTGFDVILTSPGGASTADLTLNFYENSGGSVGPALMAPITLTGASFNFLTTNSFVVPNVVVPDNFIWSVDISNVSGGISVFLSDPAPTVGSSPSYFYGRIPFVGPSFQQHSAASVGRTTVNPPAVITAVAIPEPSSIVLLLGGGILLRRLRRKRTG